LSPRYDTKHQERTKRHTHSVTPAPISAAPRIEAAIRKLLRGARQIAPLSLIILFASFTMSARSPALAFRTTKYIASNLLSASVFTIITFLFIPFNICNTATVLSIFALVLPKIHGIKQKGSRF
jgi:hypothetical protein